jgi:hypothetical protein
VTQLHIELPHQGCETQPGMLCQPSRLGIPFSAEEAGKSSHNRADCSVGIGPDIEKGAPVRDPSIEVWKDATWKKNTRDMLGRPSRS